MAILRTVIFGDQRKNVLRVEWVCKQGGAGSGLCFFWVSGCPSSSALLGLLGKGHHQAGVRLVEIWLPGHLLS